MNASEFEQSLQSRVLDLHHHALGEALDVFLRYYKEQLKTAPGVPFKVIHGYGSSGRGGEIRAMLRSVLESQRGRIQFIEGEAAEDNPGYTLIYPSAPLPSWEKLTSQLGYTLTRPQPAPEKSRLRTLILEYCNKPKSYNQIIDKFHEYDLAKIKSAIAKLKRKGKLAVIRTRGRSCYVTVQRPVESGDRVGKRTATEAIANEIWQELVAENEQLREAVTATRRQKDSLLSVIEQLRAELAEAREYIALLEEINERLEQTPKGPRAPRPVEIGQGIPKTMSKNRLKRNNRPKKHTGRRRKKVGRH